MIDEATSNQGQAGAAPGSAANPEPSTSRAGFCQECGRALTRDTLRRVGNGVFCDPCATLRQSSRGWQPVSPNGYPGAIPPGAVPPVASEPKPVFAGILGLIPGVGAMYNGQYAKGAMHLVVFVVLLAVADNLNWYFYWLVWGWVFYQAFEAYHTARARRDSLPLPNPFGWNDIGERLGMHRPSPSSSSYTPYTPQGHAQARRTAPNWAGYVPPSGPEATTYTTNPEPASHNPYTAPYAPPQPPPVPPVQPPPTNVPYGPTFTGGAVAQPFLVPRAISCSHRFPIGALWLIALGMLFLAGNLLPASRLSGRWLVPIFLSALSFWIALRRWELWRNAASATTSLAGVMVAPVMLLTVSALLALQAGRVVAMHHSWPVLLVVWGAMLLMQRGAAAIHPSVSVPPVEMPTVVPPPVRSTSGTGSLGL